MNLLLFFFFLPGYDFGWLGSVLCRKAEICDVVVSIQELEKKIVFTGLSKRAPLEYVLLIVPV